MPGLFRAEAIERTDTIHLGSVQRQYKFDFLPVFIVSVSVVAAVVALLFFGELTKKASLPGVVVAVEGEALIGSPQQAVVAAILVAEGEKVSVDTELFRLRVDRQTSAGAVGAQVERSIAQRQLALDHERAMAIQQHEFRDSAVRDRIRGLKRQLDLARAEQVVLSKRKELANQTIERVRELVDRGYMAQLAGQARLEELLEIEAREMSASRTVSSIESELEAAKSEKQAAYSSLRIQLSQIDQQLTRVEQERAENGARQSLVITSPVAGVFTGLTVYRGQFVGSGQTLATVVPVDRTSDADGIDAHLYGPSRSIGFVKAGQRVWVRLAAFPYQKFGMVKGYVKDVSRMPLAPQDLPNGRAQFLMEGTRSSEPLFRVTVGLESQYISAYGERVEIRPGMALEADVVVERRTIAEWLIDPLRSVVSFQRATLPK